MKTVRLLVSIALAGAAFLPSSEAFAARPPAGPDGDAAAALFLAIDAVTWTEDLEGLVAALIADNLDPATDLSAAAAAQAAALHHLKAAAMADRLVFRAEPGRSAETLDTSRLEFLVWLSYANALAKSRAGRDGKALDQILGTIKLGTMLETAGGGDIRSLAAGFTVREAGYVQLQRLLGEALVTDRQRRRVLRDLERSKPKQREWRRFWRAQLSDAPRVLHRSADQRSMEMEKIALAATDARIARHDLDACHRPFDRDRRTAETPLSFAAAEAVVRRCHLEATYRATRLAVAISGYRADHRGALPKTLIELTPRYIRNPPPDPFCAAPFRYSHLNGGWLYSCGGDFRGDPAGRSPYDIVAPAYALHAG